MIMLSGTPTPESYSQYYHLFTLSNNSPFKEYKNFYKWANDYVDITQKYLGYAQVKDYSNARRKTFGITSDTISLHLHKLKLDLQLTLKR